MYEIGAEPKDSPGSLLHFRGNLFPNRSLYLVILAVRLIRLVALIGLVLIRLVLVTLIALAVVALIAVALIAVALVIILRHS